MRIDGYFGVGEGPIFLDRVTCDGHEDRLLDCPSMGLEVHSCNHNQDAGVVCRSGKPCMLQDEFEAQALLLQEPHVITMW